MPQRKAKEKVIAVSAKSVRKAARQQHGALVDHVVSQGQASKYRFHLTHVWAWAFGTVVIGNIHDYDRLDDLLAEYIQVLWEEGEPKHWAAYTLAAIQHRFPRSRNRIPSGWRLKAAWDRIELPARAPPLTVLFLQALAGAAIEIGCPRFACGLLVAFHSFLRTGELLSLRRTDVTFSRSCRSAILNLHFTKGGVRRNQQEIVSLDDPTLARWLFRILAPLSAGDTLIEQRPYVFRKLFSDLIQVLQLNGFGFKPYPLRRGGATHHYRTFAEINATSVRGRWSDIRTARIYITDGLARLQELQVDKKHEDMLQDYVLRLQAECH